ncbi:MAG: hypothetical protein E7642_05955 [Ruminococcaceae bacterium]|nr:hypothetical protein [Oscillospiraceae bacterium]
MKLLKVISIFLLLTIFISSCAKTPQDEVSRPTEETKNGDYSENSETLGEFGAELNLRKVIYKASKNGKIVGESEQYVKNGEDTKEVKAVAEDGYVFAGWSDGVKDRVRQDKDVREDISVTANFLSVNDKFTVKYAISKGGKIIDVVEKRASVEKTISYTAPKNPPLAYTEGEWDDGVVGAKRVDDVCSHGQTFIYEYKPLAAGVPTIEIKTKDGGGVTDRINYKECKVTLANTEEEYCFDNVSAQIRGRGNSSWGYPKKGFRLKFDEKIEILGAGHKAKSWNFISNYGDKSLIRNMIAYDMSSVLSGLDYTVMHEFIDVYIDGDYCGLYMVTDKIDVSKGRLDLDKNIYSDPSKMTFVLEIGATNDDNKADMVKNVDCFSTSKDSNGSYYINYPETDDPAYRASVHLTYIKDYVEQCLDALSNEDWDLICDLIDIDSFIDHYIIQELYANKDGFWRSVYFYKAPNGKLYAGPVWDLDQGAGNVSGCYAEGAYETYPYTDFEYESSKYHKELGKPWIACASTWYRRLLRNEEFVELLRARLAEVGPALMVVLEKATTDGSVADSYYSLYSEAMERNFERWKIMGKTVWPNTPAIVDITTVKGQIDYMREWLIERYDVLCEHYEVY